MKKKILSVILASVMCLTSLVTAEALTGSPVVSISAEAASYKTGTYKVTHSNGVNVRKGAGTKYSKVGAAAKGTTFKVTKTKNANGYTWGYTDSIKCTNGKKSGWVVLEYCKYQSEPTTKTAEISFKGVTFPSSITKGKGQHLSGTISSTQNITKIRATVDYLVGEIVFGTVIDYTVKPNSKSYSLYDSSLDYALPFGTLSEGDYALTYSVSSGSVTKTIKMNFTVKGAESVEPDTSYTEDTSDKEGAFLDLEASLKYAEKYWDNYNSDYTNQAPNGGDCANFVSQILVAGGLKTDSEWENNKHAFINVDGLEEYLSNTYNIKCYLNSKAYDCCKVKNSVTKKNNIKVNDIKAGDIIVTTGSGYDYNGHVMFVTKVENGTVYASGHTNDRNSIPVGIGGDWGIQGVIKTSELYK